MKGYDGSASEDPDVISARELIRTRAVNSRIGRPDRSHLLRVSAATRVVRLYRRPAEKAAARYPDREYRRMYWAAVRDDVIEPANVAALTSLRDLLARDADERIREVGRLSDVRLLDILAWQPAHP